MTDTEREIVAKVRLRMAGMHPSWIEYASEFYIKHPRALEKLELLVEQVEADPNTFAFTQTPKDD